MGCFKEKGGKLDGGGAQRLSTLKLVSPIRFRWCLGRECTAPFSPVRGKRILRVSRRMDR